MRLYRSYYTNSYKDHR